MVRWLALSDAQALSDRLESKKIVVCVGSGGVGKTTTAAAIGVRSAQRGKRVLVCTIDPARRLATSLGLAGLEHQPRQVPAELLGGSGVGQLWAMMLDQKRAFDEVVLRHTKDPATQRRILNNRIYQQISASLTGSQEYAAVAKLAEIDREGGWDLIVLDTPPTANALDFLDAPQKVADAVDSPAVKWFTGKGSGFGVKALGLGAAFVMQRVARFVGAGLLEDMAAFMVEFNEALGGFRERSREVSGLLRDPKVGFVLVCAPDPLVVDEAIYFYQRLAQYGISFQGFVCNRVRRRAGPPPPSEEVTARLALLPGLQALSPHELADASRALLGSYHDMELLGETDAAEIQRLGQKCGDTHVYVKVPFFERDVHDVVELSRLAGYVLGA